MGCSISVPVLYRVDRCASLGTVAKNVHLVSRFPLKVWGPLRLSLIRVYIAGNIANLQFNKERKIHAKSAELIKRYSSVKRKGNLWPVKSHFKRNKNCFKPWKRQNIFHQLQKEKVLNKIHTYQTEIPYKIWLLIVGVFPSNILFL